MKKSKWLAALTLVVALVASACGGDDDEGGGGTTGAGGDGGESCETTWVIGTMGALSGDAAVIGGPIHQGVEYAINEINEGGDLPCELALESEDSQGNPEQAPQLAQSLVENEELVAVVGPYFSGETLASGEFFNEAGIAFVTPSATNETIDDQGWDTFFRAVANDAVQGPTAAEFIQGQFSPQSVAVIHDNQDYSKGLAETVQSELGDAAEGPFIITPGETDFSSVVSEVKNADPDVVYYGGYAPEAGPLLKQLRDAGVDAPFVSDDGAKDPAFGELAGGAADTGAFVTCPCADPLKLEGASDFVDGIKQEYNRNPGTFAADAYDSVYLIAEALKEVDPADDVETVRQSIVEFLDGVEGHEGITKTYTFADNGEVEVDPLEDIWIYEWKNDDFISLGPASDVVNQ
ncbi:MAG TPA: branched-chain amino acid ABC transporter substrate-binding protein [Actinomycetota bacterium]|nr:branched-chain amino acid ABC transporter substrate-binding protein [Actinomycetota bacterium]